MTHRRPPVLLRLPALLNVLVLLGPAPVTAATTGAEPGSAGEPGASAWYEINLFREGDFVSQFTDSWCIGASMQMMLNITGITDDRTRTSQARYMAIAREEGPGLTMTPRRLPRREAQARRGWHAA
jgi:hypothetical protein